MELNEKKPLELLVPTRGKALPYNPFRGLNAVRLTPYGQWMLGYQSEFAGFQKNQYEVIADDRLLLITYSGKNVKIESYLQRVGRSVGSTRYKITEDSFMSAAPNLSAAKELIGEFFTLITSNPPKNWMNLFEQILNQYTHPLCFERAIIAQVSSEDGFQSLMEDPSFRKLVLLAEGNTIVVPAKNQSKLEKYLNEHGKINIIRKQIGK